MSRKKIIIPVLVLGAGVGITAWKLGFGRAADPNRILLHGNIELTEVDISFKSSGRITELLVKEGDTVKQGQVIARLDVAEVRSARDRERAALDGAQSGLQQIKTGIQFQTETLARDLDVRAADLKQAEARLAELTAGSRRQEIEQARAGVEELRTQNAQAALDWQRAQRLYANDDISTAQRDSFKTRAESTAAALKRAQEVLALVEEGPRKEQIDQARAAVDRARAAVRLSAAGRIDLERRKQEQTGRQADVERARAQLAVLETQLGDRVAVAPCDGVVLTKSAEAGEVVAAGATVVTVGEIARPWVRGYIHEQDLGRVKPGMTAEVSSDSYPGKTYRGQVTFINSEAEFTPKTIQTEQERVKLVYRIKIEVANPQSELKLNMPVDAVILRNGK
jgi:HlyD family secretion protein